jgi:Fe-S cluster assembly iron-binding protein IscA
MKEVIKMINIRFNDEAAAALKKYVEGKQNKAVRLMVVGRG